LQKFQGMNILVLGGGAREHALAWKMASSPLCDKLYLAPGNAGTASCGTNLDIGVLDFESLKAACLKYEIGMLVPGPEDPLVKGISDFFRDDPALSHIAMVGPDRGAAALEGSKAFAKAFMGRHGIPTASYREFDGSGVAPGLDFISSHGLPVVLKADGLAAGKGVVICETNEEAAREFIQMVQHGKLGRAGRKVVVEEFLEGIELSVFILCDGKSWILLPEAKDYKKIGEGDSGPNTGGMGAVSPVPFADAGFMEKVRRRIIIPTMEGLALEKIDYRGFLFFGLISVKGDPWVIEYNCRLGDPETEVIIPRMKGDLVELLLAMSQQKLASFHISIDRRAAVTTVLSSGGYPGNFGKGFEIKGIPEGNTALVFQGGTTLAEGKLVTGGGRVIAATAMGEDIREAAAASRSIASRITFEGKYFRRDIAHEFL
jgi:phosphoribosylamine--glycine ligase